MARLPAGWIFIPKFKDMTTITVEQRELVCCKDCKHRDPEDGKCDSGHGIRWNLPRPDDWFCADGERWDDDD